MTLDKGKLVIKCVYFGASLVKVGNKTLLPIKHVGHITVSTVVKPLRLTCVLHIPQLSHDLLFVRQLYCDNNCCVIFDYDSIRFKHNITGDILLHDASVGNVYVVCLPAKSLVVPANLAFSSSGAHWHHRLEHYGAHIFAILKKNYCLNVLLCSMIIA